MSFSNFCLCVTYDYLQVRVVYRQESMWPSLLVAGEYMYYEYMYYECELESKHRHPV